MPGATLTGMLAITFLFTMERITPIVPSDRLTGSERTLYGTAAPKNAPGTFSGYNPSSSVVGRRLEITFVVRR